MLSVVLETAVSLASSNLMAPPAGMPPTSVTYWSIAVVPPPSVQQTYTDRMANHVPVDRDTATMEPAQHWTTSASISMVKVSILTSY